MFYTLSSKIALKQTVASYYALVRTIDIIHERSGLFLFEWFLLIHLTILAITF